MFNKSITLCTLVSLSLLFFVASTITLRAEEDFSVQKGMELETSQSVKLRALPPEQKWIFFIEKPGEETGKIEKGEKVEVEAVKNVKRPLSEDVWLKVKTRETNGMEKSGWVYYGSNKETSNFETKQKDR